MTESRDLLRRTAEIAADYLESLDERPVFPRTTPDELREALGMLRRIRTRDDVAGPEVMRVWYVTGNILEKAGRRADALREFRKILRHDPSAFDAAERASQLA